MTQQLVGSVPFITSTICVVDDAKSFWAAWACENKLCNDQKCILMSASMLTMMSERLDFQTPPEASRSALEAARHF